MAQLRIVVAMPYLHLYTFDMESNDTVIYLPIVSPGVVHMQEAKSVD